jgi:hypothetical protein
MHFIFYRLNWYRTLSGTGVAAVLGF